jgi:HEAT repeat protein
MDGMTHGDADDPNVTPPEHGALADDVQRLGTARTWQTSYRRLDAALGAGTTEAVDAVLVGLADPAPAVRKWCAALLDHHADARGVAGLVGLLDDPVAAVRRHALHSLGCQTCKPAPLPLDVLPLLAARAGHDRSVHVRRVATHLLGCQPADGRAAAALRSIVALDPDAKVRRNARWALNRHAAPAAPSGVSPDGA